MGVAPRRFRQEEIDTGLEQKLRLLAKVGAKLLLGEARPLPQGCKVLPAGRHSEVRDRPGDQHRPVAAGLVARLASQQDRAPVELSREIAHPQRLEIVPRRGVGVRRENVDARLDVELVHELHRRGMRLERGRGPGRMLDRQSHLLELGPDGAIEDDHLALSDALLQILERIHVSLPKPRPRNSAPAMAMPQ